MKGVSACARACTVVLFVSCVLFLYLQHVTEAKREQLITQMHAMLQVLWCGHQRVYKRHARNLGKHIEKKIFKKRIRRKLKDEIISNAY